MLDLGEPGYLLCPSDPFVPCQAHKYITNNAPRLGRLCAAVIPRISSRASRTPFIPERPAIPERSSPRTPGAAPPASASQWAPNYWAAHSLPAFQGPLLFSAQHQHTHPKSLLNWGFRLFFLRGRPACSEPGHTPRCRAAPHARAVAMGCLPPADGGGIPRWIRGRHRTSSQYLSYTVSPHPFHPPPCQLFFAGIKSELL